MVGRTLLAISCLVSGVLSSLDLPTCQSSTVMPCPKVEPSSNVELSDLVGEWHVGAAVLDSDNEEYDQEDNCITVQMRSHDKSHLELSWSSNSTGAATIDLRVTQAAPSVYLVKTPLGGQVKTTVFGYERESHVLLCHCGWHGGEMVHLWSSLLTRGPQLTPQLRAKVTYALLINGYKTPPTKVIEWPNCGY